MKLVMRMIVIGLVSVAPLVGPMVSPAAAQNYSFDARRVALGGVGESGNVASKLVEEERQYGTVVVPLGLFQVLKDLDIFRPDKDNFDPVRAMEYAASPVHYTFGRSANGSGQNFVADVVNGRLDRDLNRYRGFSPPPNTMAEGLATPSWGKAFAIREAQSTFQRVYVGAGPYLALRTNAQIDQGLIDLFEATTDISVPNATFGIRNATTDQLAIAITGGYRARLPLPGGRGAGRDGVYVVANYHHLVGMHMDDMALRVAVQTDDSGLLADTPTSNPVVIDRITSRSGRGRAIDLGTMLVVDRWSVGFGASGVANRITWTDLQRKRYDLESLVSGGEFERREDASIDDSRRIVLPVNYTADVAYQASDRWAVITEYVHGFQGNNFHGGLEYRIRQVELRGGARYSRDRWHPSGGVGFNLTPNFGVDLAAFNTTANLERRDQMAVAVSLRFMRR